MFDIGTRQHSGEFNILRRLSYLRFVEVIGQLIAVFVATKWLMLDLPLAPLLGLIVLLIVINLFTWYRARIPRALNEVEILLQLLADTLVLTGLLYFSGGSTNPFVSLFLIPVTISALLLPWRHTALLGAITVTSYTLLMFYYEPLTFSQHTAMHGGTSSGMGHMHHQKPGDSNNSDAFMMHITGMWFNFIVSATIIAFFISRLTAAVRRRDKLLSTVREETLRNEQIVALGTQAASAAHELSTPLSTMAVIAGDLHNELSHLPEISTDIEILRQQIHSCKAILSCMVESAGHTRSEAAGSIHPDKLVADLLDKLYLMRPNIQIITRYGECDSRCTLLYENTLTQALLNLLNNAVDSSPDDVALHTQCTDGFIEIAILDRGPGLTDEVINKAGNSLFTTKQYGVGMGLFLSNVTIERLGGEVKMYNRHGGGAKVVVKLPLNDA